MKVDEFTEKQMLTLRRYIKKLYGEDVVTRMDEIASNHENYGLTGSEDCLVLLNMALKELGKPEMTYEDLVRDLEKSDPRIRKFQQATTACVQSIIDEPQKNSDLAHRVMQELKQNQLATEWLQGGYETFVTDAGYDLPQENYEGLVGGGVLLGMLIAKKLRLMGDLNGLAKLERDGGVITGPTSQVTLMALESLKEENVDESDIKLLEAISKVSQLHLQSGEELANYAKVVEEAVQKFRADKNFQTKIVQSAVLAGVALGWRMREIAELVEKGSLTEIEEAQEKVQV